MITSMIVVNTRTGEAYITDSEEAKLITCKYAMREKMISQRSINTQMEYNTGNRVFSTHLTYITAFGDVKVSDVISGFWKAYPDTPAARVLYKANR